MTRQDTRFIVWLEEMDQLRVRWATAPRDLKPALLLTGPELGEAEMFLHSRKHDLSPEQRDYIVKSIMHGVQGRLRDREARDRVTRDSFRWWTRFAVTVSIVVTLFGVEFAAINVWHRYWVEPEISKLMTERARTRTAQSPQPAPAVPHPATKKPVKYSPTGHPEPDEEDPSEPVPRPLPIEQKLPQQKRFAEPASRLIDLAQGHMNRGETEVAALLALESLLDPSAGGTRTLNRASPSAISILLQAQAERRTTLAEPVQHPELSPLKAPSQRLAQFSADGRRIVIASNDSGARLFDVDAGKAIAAATRVASSNSLAVLSPDGSRLVTANEEDTASLWDATDGKLVGTFSAHEGQVVAAVFSGDGKLVLSGSQDGTARLWDARTGGLVAVLRGHDATVLAVAFSKDGTRLATASEDKTVRIWSAAGEEVAALKGHQGPVVEVAFLGGRDELVTTSYDGTVRIWHVDRPLEGRIFEGRTSPLLAAFASHDGTRVLLVGSMDAPEIRDTSSGSVVARLLSAPFAIRSARFAEDGKTIMTLSWDGLLQIWSAATGEPLATLNRGEERFESAAFTNWERRIAALNSDHRVIVFPAPTEAEGVIDDARRRFSRCLSREERSELNIEATPPHWCQAELPPAPITSIE